MPLPDLVKPLKLEAPFSGGTQLDPVPTEVNSLQDAMSSAGLYVQNTAASSADKAVLIDRTTNALRFTDASSVKLLTELVSAKSGATSAHNALPDLVHLALGPGDGWASGAYLTETVSGLLVTNRTWWTSTAQQTRIYAETYTYTGLLLAGVTRTIYSAGSAIRQYVDTLNYAGLVLSSTTRTWS